MSLHTKLPRRYVSREKLCLRGTTDYWVNALDPRRVMEITFEVARLGESGLDYANPEKKYTVSAYPGESFSGLQLMCLMYAGFKRIAPDQDTGMDLNEPWITAMGLFNDGK